MRRRLSEAGSVSLEAVLLVPALVLTLLAVVQLALVAHAGHLVDTAAREGARAARLSGMPEDGRRRAEDFLARTGGEVVLGPEIQVTISGDTVVVEVSGHVTALLSGAGPTVTGTSRGIVERFIGGRR